MLAALSRVFLLLAMKIEATLITGPSEHLSELTTALEKLIHRIDDEAKNLSDLVSRYEGLRMELYNCIGKVHLSNHSFPDLVRNFYEVKGVMLKVRSVEGLIEFSYRQSFCYMILYYLGYTKYFGILFDLPKSFAMFSKVIGQLNAFVSVKVMNLAEAAFVRKFTRVNIEYGFS